MLALNQNRTLEINIQIHGYHMVVYLWRCLLPKMYRGQICNLAQKKQKFQRKWNANFMKSAKKNTLLGCFFAHHRGHSVVSQRIWYAYICGVLGGKTITRVASFPGNSQAIKPPLSYDFGKISGGRVF